MSRPQKTVENLTIYDNGNRGLSYDFKRIIEYGSRFKDGIEYPLTEEHSQYGGISNDDMLDYTMEENFPYYDELTEEEKKFFISEYNRIKRNLKHSDYYDPYDNTWKNYE